MLEQGDVVAMFFGHDHKNSFVVNHKGIDLSTTPGVGFSSYGDINRGVRVIDLDTKDLSTYKTEVIRWVDFYDVKNDDNAEISFILHGNEYSFGVKLLAFAKLMVSSLAPVINKIFEISANIFKSI